jgi:ADP-ribose pyrophosphatase YjhB (NUDIX family)
VHDDQDFTHPPRRRIGALGLIRDEAGRVLLVEKAYKAGPQRWGLPGGCTYRDEDATRACVREVFEETGLEITPGRVLTVHRMPASTPAAEGYNLVFDCGVIPSGTRIVLDERELTGHRWVRLDDLGDLVAPYTEWRINVALEASDGAPVRYLTGHPPTPTTHH